MQDLVAFSISVMFFAPTTAICLVIENASSSVIDVYLSFMVFDNKCLTDTSDNKCCVQHIEHLIM